jgi:hypothetical protein
MPASGGGIVRAPLPPARFQEGEDAETLFIALSKRGVKGFF